MKSLKIQTEHGFTLLETVLAILVIGIMALLAIPRILDTDRRAAYITAHQIVADMRLARAAAIANATDCTAEFQESEGRYVGYRIFWVKQVPGEDDEVIVVKSMAIPDQLTFDTVGSGGGWPPNLVFTQLGNIRDTISGEDNTIAHVTGGGHQVNIEATVATGKVSVQ